MNYARSVLGQLSIPVFLSALLVARRTLRFLYRTKLVTQTSQNQPQDSSRKRRAQNDKVRYCYALRMTSCTFRLPKNLFGMESALIAAFFLLFGTGALAAQVQTGSGAFSSPVPRAQNGSANHLAGSKSQYLQRAVNQPVDWHPWGAAAFAQAAKLNRPVLLDVGAIWCALCASMDKESYTDPALAAFINANFVAVKVDYDADAKLSARLQRAQAYINVPSGLPLTAFVTPAGKLYRGGSYFPPKAKRDKPAFRDELQVALAQYRNQDESLIQKQAFDLHLENEFLHEAK